MKFSWLILIIALAGKESGNDPNAFNKREDAAGILQIRPIFVRDVNRIYKGRLEPFTLEDRYSKGKSVQMAVLLLQHYCGPGDYERAARIFNGGPDANEPEELHETNAYWRDIKRRINDQYNN